ncbi:hypothetical protein Dsin_011564 [Dipteronia sinensis]|uniref:DDE Tnp4 domain-containing protein n=1 Tax=Dipteronia sinensis TaxID=43782 RepID=A0AAE0AVW7_9ROSI|nr:hypothetical protein Dsin_011564 [Dipteronia sinensis]
MGKLVEGCLGAVDGTYIKVIVPKSHKPRYRTRKGHIATNVLGVCTRDLKFVYVLSGWEGSTTDSRVLRDAITRHNGLKIPFEQTPKWNIKRNVSSAAADITNVFEKSMERASTDIAKLTGAITRGDAMTRLGVVLEGVSLDSTQVIRVAMYF